jgi:hypothetical protein
MNHVTLVLISGSHLANLVKYTSARMSGRSLTSLLICRLQNSHHQQAGWVLQPEQCHCAAPVVRQQFLPGRSVKSVEVSKDPISSHSSGSAHWGAAKICSLQHLPGTSCPRALGRRERGQYQQLWFLSNLSTSVYSPRTTSIYGSSAPARCWVLALGTVSFGMPRPACWQPGGFKDPFHPSSAAEGQLHCQRPQWSRGEVHWTSNDTSPPPTEDTHFLSGAGTPVAVQHQRVRLAIFWQGLHFATKILRLPALLREKQICALVRIYALISNYDAIYLQNNKIFGYFF